MARGLTYLAMKNLLFNMLRLRERKLLSTKSNWSPDLKVWRNWMPSAISWVRLVVGYVNRSKAIQAATFARTAVRIGARSGSKGLVLYLKTSHVMLMQACPGSKLKANSRDIGKTGVARAADGIPRIIPRFARDAIRRGDKSCIRLYLTFFGIYRVLECSGSYSVKTIITPGVEIPKGFLTEWRNFVYYEFLPRVSWFTGWKMRDLAASKVLSRPQPRMIQTSSADSTAQVFKDEYGVTVKTLYDSSFASRFNSANAWVKGLWGGSLPKFLQYLTGGIGTTKSLWTMIQETAEIRRRYLGMAKAPVDFCPRGDSSKSGRLAFLEEPAGKVRVVALLDYWTQLALHPLHTWIFECLKEIPQDGTFDQLKPIKRLLKRCGKHDVFYSFDLSAATDRLSVKLQCVILQCVFGKWFAVAWKRLLVNREYSIPETVSKSFGLPSKVRYAVGQPMGGYSSWAMLALTHHCMVQFSAKRAGVKAWFDLYAVLGDDVVIADAAVARQYRILCRTIGLEIGIHKSLISEDLTLEFAKRFFFRGEDVSGLPIAFWAAAQSTMGVAHALSAWVPAGSLGNFIRALGVGFRGAASAGSSWNSMKLKTRALLVTLTHPLVGSRFSYGTWPEWLWSSGPGLKGLPFETLAEFTPFATALLEEVLLPVERMFEKYQEDLFFTEKVSDPASRLVDVTTNRMMTEAEASLTKAVGAMKHLQRLNLKFQLQQVSAILTQVTRMAEKVTLVPVPAVRGMRKINPEGRLVSITDVYRYWSKIRSRGNVVEPRITKERNRPS